MIFFVGNLLAWFALAGEFEFCNSLFGRGLSNCEVCTECRAETERTGVIVDTHPQIAQDGDSCLPNEELQ